LIELSIVLIIIGLLIAGVSGGKSLVDSAKTNKSISKIREVVMGINSYYERYNMMPTDTNGDGFIGYNGGDDINKMIFSAPYNGIKNYSNFIQSAPFIELLEKGFIKNNEFVYNGNSVQGLNFIYFSTTSRTSLTFRNRITTCSYCSPTTSLNNSNNLFIWTSTNTGYIYRKEIKTIQRIDKKIDDGLRNTGRMFMSCDGSNDYETSTWCDDGYYKLDKLF
jgi:type II secretory pathway pseudopilin PulG